MRSEPVASRVGNAGGASSAQGLARPGLCLGASVLLHGAVLLLLLLREQPLHPRVFAPPPAVEVEVLWREGSGSPPGDSSTALPPAPTPLPAPAPLKRSTPPAAAASRSREPVAPLVEKVAPAPDSRPEPAPPLVAEGVDSSPRTVTEDVRRVDPHPGPLPEGEGISTGLAVGGGEGSRSGPGPGPSGSGGMGAGGSVDLSAYGQRLSSLVTRQRRYPPSAVRLRMAGTAVVRVLVRRDGSLAAPPRLVTSSRYGVLDAEALRMVEAAAPFAPLPEGYSQPSAEFVVPVHFSLRSSE